MTGETMRECFKEAKQINNDNATGTGPLDDTTNQSCETRPKTTSAKTRVKTGKSVKSFKEAEPVKAATNTSTTSTAKTDTTKKLEPTEKASTSSKLLDDPAASLKADKVVGERLNEAIASSNEFNKKSTAVHKSFSSMQMIRSRNLLNKTPATTLRYYILNSRF